jgi:hypothetical protein
VEASVVKVPNRRKWNGCKWLLAMLRWRKRGKRGKIGTILLLLLVMLTVEAVLAACDDEGQTTTPAP